MVGVVMFCVVVHGLTNKETFLAGVMLLSLVMYFYVFLDNAVFVTPKSTPGAHAVEVLLLDSWRKVEETVQTVADVTVPAALVFTLPVFLVAGLVVGLVVA